MTRGDIYEVNLPSTRGGHEQSGRRYAVILQIDELLELSTVIVAPTSTKARPATFRPAIAIGDKPTRVLVEQIRAVDARRLSSQAGRLSVDEQRRVDEALATVLGI